MHRADVSITLARSCRICGQRLVAASDLAADEQLFDLSGKLLDRALELHEIAVELLKLKPKGPLLKEQTQRQLHCDVPF
jgi:hypothetical protein